MKQYYPEALSTRRTETPGRYVLVPRNGPDMNIYMLNKATAGNSIIQKMQIWTLYFLFDTLEFAMSSTIL